MPRRKERKTNSRRKVGTKPQQKSIRVYTEGKVTEPCYLQMLNSNFSAVNIDWIERESGHQAVSIINAAKKFKRTTKSADLPDQIWCIWDVDDLTEADIASFEDLARAAGIQNAISNPCFELWLILHERNHAAHIERNNIQSLARAAGLIDGKTICCCYDWLFTQSDKAQSRAIVLEDGHINVGSKKSSNPSSGMHELVKAVAELQKEYDNSLKRAR